MVGDSRCVAVVADAADDLLTGELIVDVGTDRFPIMGTTAEIQIVGGDPTFFRIARGRLADLERRWSRFQPTSEVTRLNHAGGESVRVSSETLTLVRRALDGFEITEGRFDPFQLDALERLGYRTSFSAIDRPTVRRVGANQVDASEIDVNDDASTVSLPPGTRFDPGGIAKGLAADFLAEELMALGTKGVCINIGGDLRVAGDSRYCNAWTVEVRDGADDEARARVSLANGAVATTSRSRRRWRDADGIEHHHVIDPATGESARTPAVHATAIAATGWQAEVLSTVAFLDCATGIALAESLGATALVAVVDRVVVGPQWSRFTPTLEVAA